jgi:hypothetical protein
MRRMRCFRSLPSHSLFLLTSVMVTDDSLDARTRRNALTGLCRLPAELLTDIARLIQLRWRRTDFFRDEVYRVGEWQEAGNNIRSASTGLRKL